MRILDLTRLSEQGVVASPARDRHSDERSLTEGGHAKLR